MPSKDKLKKKQEKDEKREEEEQKNLLDQYWNEGTNKKGEKKAKMENEKQMEKLQKQKEKKYAEEADNNFIDNTKVKIKKHKKTKGDDLDLLNQALKSAPKTKPQKEIERKEKEKEFQKRQEEILKIKKIEKEELLEREKIQNSHKNISYNHNYIMDLEINNTLDQEEEFITGIDNILDNISNVNTTKTYKEFYNEKLVVLKNAFPKLKISQYENKIFNLWKKSPYNKDKK